MAQNQKRGKSRRSRSTRGPQSASKTPQGLETQQGRKSQGNTGQAGGSSRRARGRKGEGTDLDAE